jgi:hypothetical protein
MGSWILFVRKSSMLRMGVNVALEGRRYSAIGTTWEYSTIGLKPMHQ